MLNKLFKFHNGLSILLFIVFVKVKPTTTKDNFCFSPVYLKPSWTDRRPYFKVNMTFTDNGIKSMTWVEQDIPNPVVKIRILQTNGDNKVSTLYNMTARLCDIQQLISKIPLFQVVADKALKQGNYSYVCPMKQGFYIMDNMRVGGRSPVLAFMYRPKTTFTFLGGMYEESANKSLLPLTTYKFTIKIIKKSCKES